jgi:hypothetical protein
VKKLSLVESRRMRKPKRATGTRRSSTEIKAALRAEARCPSSACRAPRADSSAPPAQMTDPKKQTVGETNAGAFPVQPHPIPVKQRAEPIVQSRARLA